MPGTVLSLKLTWSAECNAQHSVLAIIAAVTISWRGRCSQTVEGVSSTEGVWWSWWSWDLKSINAAPKSKIVCFTCPLPLLTVLCSPVFQTPFVMHQTCLLSPFRGLPFRMHAHNFVHVEILHFSQDSLSPEPFPGCPPWNSHGILYRGTWERELFRITLYLPTLFQNLPLNLQ